MTAEIAPTTAAVDDAKETSPTHLEMTAEPVQGDEGADSPQNPRNWPLWKKNIQIVMVAFHSMMGTFTAAGIIPAYDDFAKQYNVSVPTASYLTSFQVALHHLQLYAC